MSLSLEAPVREALKLICEDNVPGVPVVGEDSALEGFVTDGYLIASALPRYMRLMDNLSYPTFTGLSRSAQTAGSSI